MSDLMLSVAVITYNQEKSISQTLESILTQIHNYSYEIVIGDDCSSDGTRNVIAAYVEKYPGIIKPIYNNENLGLIGNYFNVIEHCSGKYIMECAGDDWWLPGKVSKQINFLENNKDVGLYYGKGKIFRNNKIQKNRFWGKQINVLEDLLFSGMNLPFASSCFRNEIIKEYITDEDPANKNWFSEDYSFAIWLILNKKIVFDNYFYFVYRVSDKGLSHSKNIEKTVKNITLDYEMKLYFLKKYNYENLIEKNYKQYLNSLLYIYIYGNEYKKAIDIVKKIPIANLKEKIKFSIIKNPITFLLFKLYLNLFNNDFC